MSSSQKILVVRVGRAGDLIMITPALLSLLAAFPEAEFHLLTTAEGARVMRGFHDRLTRTYVYSRRFPRSWFRQLSLGRTLAREGFDRIYVFEAKPLYRKWLGKFSGAFFGFESATPDAHYCERCMRVVAGSMDHPVEHGWVSIPVTDVGRDKAQALLSSHGIGPDDLVVGLHPTFSGSGLPFFRDRVGMRHRNWPEENFSRLARLLRETAEVKDRKLAVIIDALPEERRIIEPIVEAASGAITLLSAPPDFERYKGLLARLDVLVTPNTGPMHVAAAVNTSLVALFSRWSVADCGPYVDPTRYEILRAEDTPHPERGLAAITPEQTAEAVWRMLDRFDRPS